MMRALMLALLLICGAPAPAHEPAARNELAASAAVDLAGNLWVVSARGGRLFVQKSAGDVDALSAPVAVFDAPMKVLAQGENRPKIAVTDKGVILVTFTTAGSAPYSGHVHFSRSTDGGRSFSRPRLINDDTRDISHRFDNLIIEGSGRIRVVWIDRRDVADGRAKVGASIFTAWSDDEGASWSPNARLAQSSCECCRIALATDAAGKAIALWRHVFEPNIRDHALMAVDDKNLVRATFSDWRLDACPHQGPALAIDKTGVRHLVAFAGIKDGGLFYSRLDANGKPLGQPQRLTDTGAHAAIFTRDQEVLVAWIRFDGETHRLELARSKDAGETWQPAVTLRASAGPVDQTQWLMRHNAPVLFWRTRNEGLQLIKPPQS